MMTIGIGFSLKSNLGVSPVSSIPYTITLVFGIEMGKATILFHIALILMQFIILRKDFKFKNIGQLIVAVLFGYFTTFSNYLMTFLPTTDNYTIRLTLLFVSIIFVAVGIFLYLPPDMIPLAGEGAMQALSKKTRIEFPRIKVTFDTSMVIISGITCLFVLHSIGSVGIGTIISAILVGTVLNFITKLFREKLDKFLNYDTNITFHEIKA